MVEMRFRLMMQKLSEDLIPIPVPLEFCIEPWGCDQHISLSKRVIHRKVLDYMGEHCFFPSEEIHKDDNVFHRSIFRPDEVIKKLFHIRDNETLDFFDIPTCMSKLYYKSNLINISWSPKYHCLFPIEKRQYIENMIKIGYQISYKIDNHGFDDIWKEIIISQLPEDDKILSERIIIRNKINWQIKYNNIFNKIIKKKIMKILKIGYQISNKINNYGFVDIWKTIIMSSLTYNIKRRKSYKKIKYNYI